MRFETQEHEFASKGVAGTGLGLGIAGTALGLLNNNGGLGGILGGTTRSACNEDHFVNRYESAQSARIAELETEVKLRDANAYTDQKLLEDESPMTAQISPAETDSTCSNFSPE